MTYEPRLGDWVRVLECQTGDSCHKDMVGIVVHVWGNGKVNVRSGRETCTAIKYERLTPPSHSIFTRAEQQCAELRATPAVLDELMHQLLGIVATVHGMQVAAKENNQTDEKGANRS